MTTRSGESQSAETVVEPTVDQGSVIAFLGSGRAFGCSDQAIERIDTHAAIVFLVGDRAYKLKRAVLYSFLDFSTVERRHRILEAEYRLNIRTAPKLYRRLVPVTCEDDGHLALNGDGRVVDWLLEMTRFDQAGLLDRLAEEGKLDTPLIHTLAYEIAALHEKAPVRHGGGYAALAAIVDGNADDLASLADDIGREDTVASLVAATRAELARKRECLNRRAQDGFVRHCHGDLHLGNIFLDGGRPVLFDCLEFNEELATVDVFYDLAFILMDLCHRGLDELAIELLGAYLDRTEDDGGASLLPLFLAIRATIRAKIEGFEIRTAASPAERSKHQQSVNQYLDLAGDLLAVEPPRLIAIGGLSGTGKSTVARLLAHALGQKHWTVVLRSDVIRKRLMGASLTTRLDADAYSSERSAGVYQRLYDRAAALLHAGRTVIADATFLDPSDRTRIEDLAADHSVSFDGFWLDASRQVLERRIAMRHGDASDADVGVLAKQLDRDLGVITWTLIDASGGAEQIASEIRSRAFRGNKR